MDQNLDQRYAALLLKVGVSLQRGQKLFVAADIVHRPFVVTLAEEAYKLGATYVHWDPIDTRIGRARRTLATDDSLEFVPSWLDGFWRELIDDDWAYLYIDGAEDPFIYEGIDSERLHKLGKAYGRRRSVFLEAISKSEICWTVAAYPTLAWAENVVGAGQEPIERFWKELFPILRLDQSDPAEAWRKHVATLQKRCQVLQDLEVDSLHFSGPGTDLTVGLLPISRWRGGGEVSARGRSFCPNLPTEEVFTTPDWRRTAGKVVCTRPVEILGVQVEGASFVFEKGRVVSFDARKGRDVLERFLKSDAQSNALGEVALVDGASKIFASGLTFHSILFDENAACHIAFGNGYPDAIEGGREAKREDLLDRGCNTSIVHVDFMIGGPEVTVEGRTRSGRNLVLLSEGRFTGKDFKD